MTAPTIINVYPSNGAIGIPVADQIKVYFNQEMDLSSINTGTFVLVGKDNAPIFGPVDVTPLDDPGFDDEDILSSPYLGAYVKGTIEFYKTDASGAILDNSIVDEDGDGTLWNTLAVFVPEKPLSANSTYQIFVLGDENTEDDFKTGVTSRTVFDTKALSVSGTGTVQFYGGYTGTITTTYTLEITQGGPTGTAEYIWYPEGEPLNFREGRTTTGERELENGVYLTCSNEGNFTIGDTFTVKVVPAVVMTSNYQWSFSTGSGSILTPPSTSSTSGIGELDTSALVGGLQIVSITPDDRETNLDPTEVTTIVVVFNKDLDASTITDDTVLLWSEPVMGDHSLNNIEFEGRIAKVLSVSGNTLTIQIS